MAGIEINLNELKEKREGKVEYNMLKAFEEITKDARNEGYKSLV